MQLSWKLFLIGVSFTFSSQIFAENLSPIEIKICEYITNQQEAALSLLRDLVNINSGTNNIEGVKRVGNMLVPQFEALGFNTTWMQLPVNMNRAPTLVAKRTGHSGKRLLLIGHLDTVFPPTSPFQHFSRDQNQAMGPGIIDDKGGDIVILYALKALHANHALNNVTLTVVLTGDEEDAAHPINQSRKALIDAAKESDIALDFEGTVTLDTISVARRGIGKWLLTTSSKESHSSQIFKKEVGFGAIFELVRILNTMQQELGKERYLTFNPGIVLGGTQVNYEKNASKGEAFGKGNVIAKKAMAEGDIRYLSQEQKEKAEKAIQSIVDHHLAHTQASIVFKEGIPPMPPTSFNRELLKMYNQISLDLKQGEVRELDPGQRGAGDISHIASIVKASLVGLGLFGSGEHSVKETLYIPSFAIQTQRAAVLIYRLTR